MRIFGCFWSKMNKLRIDSERKWKVCIIKVPLFILKNALGASCKHFYIFFVVPLRGHFRHTTPAPIMISFLFCFFTGKQPQIYLSAAEKINNFFNFHYALMRMHLKWQPCHSVRQSVSISLPKFSKQTREDSKRFKEIQRDIQSISQVYQIPFKYL